MAESKSTIKLKFMVHEDQTLRSLIVPLAASVLDVKLMLCNNCGFNENEHELLFCGHLMRGENGISDYNLGPQTTLHVVQRLDSPALELPDKTSIITTPYLTGIWLHRQSNLPSYIARSNMVHTNMQNLDMKNPQFYVYCKNKCSQVAPGKLRVRCASCQQDCITLHRDPRGWMDVLKTAKVLANCLSKRCKGAVCDAEFYFKCTLCKNQSGSAIPLPNVINNSNGTLCCTCFDVDNPVVSFPCSRDHSMCIMCFEQYARNSLRERRMILDTNVGYSLPCPEGCLDSYLTDTHILHILGADEYATYQAFAAEECLLQKMHGLVCPSPNCGMGLYPDLARDFHDRAKIICSKCGFKFCYTCREASHGSSACCAQAPPSAGNSYLVRDYLASVKTMEEISKKCPKCKVPTERNGGCMHMTCGRCKFEWCWNCLTEWNRTCQSNHWFF